MTLEYYQQHADDFFSATVNVDMNALYPLFWNTFRKTAGFWMQAVVPGATVKHFYSGAIA